MNKSGMRGGDRIRALVEMIPPGSRVADIGTDHALLPRILLEEGRSTFCIATEINPAALNRRRTRIGDHPLPGSIEFRAGDGLAPLRPNDRLDVIVLAGIGARTQCRILSSPALAGLGAGRLVLQPQGDPAVLRRWLAGNRYRIAQERLLHLRGFYHLTLAAEPEGRTAPETDPDLTTADLMAAGPCLVRSGDPVVRKYWEFQLRRLLRLEAGDPGGPGGKQAVRDREQAERILETLPPDKL